MEFVLGLVGATLGTAVCSVAPAWIYLQVAPSSSGERWIAKVNSLFLKWIHLIWFVFFLQVVLVCGLGILILGTVANIYAEEEYSEIHSGTVLPPNLKEIEAKFDVIQQAIPAMANNHNRLGDNSFNDPLSFNRSAFCWDSISSHDFLFSSFVGLAIFKKSTIRSHFLKIDYYLFLQEKETKNWNSIKTWSSQSLKMRWLIQANSSLKLLLLFRQQTIPTFLFQNRRMTSQHR